ncbi:unnamed protein product, partial [Linum tenue]
PNFLRLLVVSRVSKADGDIDISTSPINYTQQQASKTLFPTSTAPNLPTKGKYIVRCVKLDNQTHQLSLPRLYNE